jgi:hypothetical protein
MKLKMVLGLLVTLTSVSFACTANANDAVAKEETTPPPAEGALTADQIPPISSLGKPITTPQTNAGNNSTSPQMNPDNNTALPPSNQGGNMPLPQTNPSNNMPLPQTNPGSNMPLPQTNPGNSMAPTTMPTPAGQPEQVPPTH